MPIEINGRMFRNIEEWQLDYIKANYQKKLTDISKVIKVDPRRIGEIIKLLNLNRQRHYKIYLPKTDEVNKELLNPYLSHVQIALKYGVTETCVAKRRKELNVTSRRKNFDTSIELAVEKILVNLDLAYIKQKRINQWSIDFYLGRKYCIDVHGKWSHSKKDIINRDNRKKEDLFKLGYKYLIIYENELTSENHVTNKIIQFTLGFPC